MEKPSTLRILRFVRGWSLDEIATMVGVDKAVISKAERGHTIPRSPILGRWLEVLEVSAGDRAKILSELHRLPPVKQ